MLDYTQAAGLDFTEPERVPHDVGIAKLKELFKSDRPFIVEEADHDVFQRVTAGFKLDRFREVFGDRSWTVQRSKRGVFEPETPFCDQTETLPVPEFLEKVENPDEEYQHYLNVWPSPAFDFANDMFRELDELGPELAMTRFGSQELRVFWIGGKGTITPLHYDTYARSHGVVEGEKLFILFPPDLKHFRALQPYSMWSPVGWHSKIAAGPIDPKHHPSLAGTNPVRALCKPGDFLYLPPCWWHHVSIPHRTTISISATFYPRRSYLYWYHWRMRISRRFAGQDRLLKKLNRTGKVAAAT